MPGLDVVEVSVFGTAGGEAICVHIGAGRWVTVDSCLHPETNEPIVLDYLASLGVDVGDAVVLIVVSHWDDDHIRGIGKTVDVCTSADVACSGAISRREVVQFVIESQEAAAGRLGSGLDEMRALLRRRDRRLIWAKVNTVLHPIPPGDSPVVMALSPSDDAFERSLTELIEGATGEARAVARRYRAPEGPNGASVATSIRAGVDSVLLGADLEKSTNPNAGWSDVVRRARPATRASLIKVPHHGSPDADDPQIWAELVKCAAVAIVTPWELGGSFRPMDDDIQRLASLGHRLFVAAVPAAHRIKLDRDVQRLVERLHGSDVFELRGNGQVRARRAMGEVDWAIDLFGDATEVPEANGAPSSS